MRLSATEHAEKRDATSHRVKPTTRQDPVTGVEKGSLILIGTAVKSHCLGGVIAGKVVGISTTGRGAATKNPASRSQRGS